MARFGRHRISEQEQRDELLSAYLDGELSADERARLEAQLAADPGLRAELDALRHTVALVRDLPSVSVPRNFILPRDVAARPGPARHARPRLAWAAPFLTAATAVVSLLFVVVLAGNLLFLGAGDRASAPRPEPQMAAEAPRELPAPVPASEEEVVAETVVEVEVTVEVELEAEGEGTLGAVPTETPLPMAAEAPPEAVSPVTVEAEEYAAEIAADADATAVAMGGGGTMEPAVPTPIPSPPAAEKAEEPLTTLPTATTVARAAVGVAEPTPSDVGKAEPPLEAAQDEEAAAAEPPPAAVESEPEQALPQRAVIPPWWALEVALGLIALGLAFATVRAWRARRR
jgi:hypothetical protein